MGTVWYCPECKGEKKRATQVIGHPVLKQIIADCMVCSATGRLTAEQMKAYKSEVEMWCRCSGIYGLEKIPLGPNNTMNIVHWRCMGCHNISRM